ncbi:YbhB/YbcL family Raf kinase inhibitor-like protein [Microbacterium deminutum]|uniref:YbhB/YbcL family Raf kinase inhibitor-like protein n=1 Tax=Microbacterium deminutum TaxID=344164 RepID=A0ABN2RAU8_9MICO
MRLTSSDFDDHGVIAARHGKKFENLKPRLSCSGVPAAAGSLALSMVDTHPVARGYVHWLMDGIPPMDGEFVTTSGIAVGRELKTYAGPFPPSGTHLYEFTLFALDRSAPEAPLNTPLAAFVQMMTGHVLATATLTGSFTKPKA